MIHHEITAGLSTVFREAVPPSSSSYGSKELDSLLSTPTIVLLTINASAKMLDPLLPPGYITVGSKIEVSHESPTLVGEQITLNIRVTKVEGPVIYLDFSVSDDNGVVSKGRYERHIVSIEKLMNIAYSRFAKL